MAFVSIDPADVQPGKFGKAELFDRIRTNLDDLNSRVSGSTPAVLFDDFNWHWDAYTSLGGIGDISNRSFQEYGGIKMATLGEGRDWGFYRHENGTNAQFVAANAIKPSVSVARMTATVAPLDGVEWCHLNSKIQFQETLSIDPLIFGARCRISNDVDLRVGMAAEDYILNPNHKIQLVRNNATNWNFRARNSAGVTNSAAFARPPFNTWFIVKIVFSSGEARCFIDGAEKAVLTTNLPTTTVLQAIVGLIALGQGTFHLDIDWVSYTVAGLLEAP